MTAPRTPGRGESSVVDSHQPRPGTNPAWDLVQQIQAGHTDAYGDIYRRYYDKVFRYIRFRVDGADLAEDLAADTFVSALKLIGSFTWQGRDISAWLMTIARNRVADHYKSSRYRRERLYDFTVLGTSTVDEVVQLDVEDLDPAVAPEAAVLDYLDRYQLLTLVQRLPSAQRNCVCARYLQGRSVAETAALIGRSESAVTALTYRAVQSLTRALGREVQAA